MAEAANTLTAANLEPRNKSFRRHSLDRNTEQDSIVVDEGYCDVDPSFGDAADRLACLELEDLESSSRPSSTRSLGDTHKSSSKGLGSASSRSLKNSSAGASSSSRSLTKSGAGGTSTSSSARTPSPLGVQPAASSARATATLEPLLSIKSSGSLPPGSPFAKMEFQNTHFPTMSPEEAEVKLKSMAINDRLFSGLQSLSADELTVFMQLTEELKQEGVGQSASTVANPGSLKEGANRSEPISSKGSQDDEERLENAVRKLKSLLPKSAIAQLQSHSSYGLMDVIHSQPLTPPPTPTSTATDA